MKGISKKTGTIVFIVLTIFTTFFTLAKYSQSGQTKGVKTISKGDTVSNNIIDTAKLELLSKVYKNLDPSRNEYFLSGLINANNGADTSDHLINTEYILSKKGNEFYLKFGKTETINANGICIYVDHGIKKIMISKESKIVTGITMASLADLTKQVKEEGFNMKSDKTGDTESIILRNPYHLSCKEYMVSFKSNTLKPERVYVRLSSFEEPENSKKDNVVDLKINDTQNFADIDKYTTQNFVVKQDGKWVLNANYKDYELIDTH